ncbi:MAG: PEGA domain-containing protein [Gammaproteobacteria bacterium]|nr:PEGA domain-containing protein [Gammaproteobacteria bacterium]
MAVVAAGVQLSGCATIVKGTTQKVPVASDPSGADVIVDGNLSGQTPTTVELKRKNDHLVTLEKTGYQSRSVAVVKSVGGAVWGNILAGGLIGWGVDAADGAQYNLVPVTINAKLEPLAAAAPNAGSDDAKVFIDQLRVLDKLHEGKQISDADYAKARLALFKKYMPDAIPANNPAAGENAQSGKVGGNSAGNQPR